MRNSTTQTAPSVAVRPKVRDTLYWLLVAISVATIASGLGQAVMPQVVLGLVGGEITPATNHFFGIVGMFMVLFGGMLLHGLISAQHHSLVVFWAGLQKLGASAAVGIGVARLIFGPLALLVAAFDLVSALLIFWYLWRITRRV